MIPALSVAEKVRFRKTGTLKGLKKNARPYHCLDRLQRIVVVKIAKQVVDFGAEPDTSTIFHENGLPNPRQKLLSFFGRRLSKGIPKDTRPEITLVREDDDPLAITRGAGFTEWAVASGSADALPATGLMGLTRAVQAAGASAVMATCRADSG
jgi:hypothetical protein